MENSKIQWTHHTFNPWRGCTKVSPGCQNCYAERGSHRNPDVLGMWGSYGTRVVASVGYWHQPIYWNAEARACNRRDRVFCASLADVFEGTDTIPGGYGLDVERARVRLFELIRETPCLDWLLLTKRPENVVPMYVAWLEGEGQLTPPPNVWIGATAENQEYAERRAPILVELRRLGFSVAFLSCEPQLGPIDARPWLHPDDGINWVIAGGESGAAAKIRPFDPHWARMLRDQCDEAGVNFFMKQLGEKVVGTPEARAAACRFVRPPKKGGHLSDMPEEIRVRTFPRSLL